MTGAGAPRITVGLPVRDGERFLDEAIDSIRRQSLSDFRLILADNASSDRTSEICRDHAAADERLRYVRHETNIGAAGNFNHVFRMADGEYFKWAADDDRLDERFLERTVSILDGDPTVVLAFSRIRIVHADGTDQRRGYANPLPEIGSEEVHRRFSDLLFRRHGCFHVWGVMRRASLDRTALIGGYIGSDRALLAELALQGRFVDTPEDLFQLRDHQRRSVKALPLYERGAWFDPSRAGQRQLPHWRLLAALRHAIDRAPLEPEARRRCRLELMRWPFVGWNPARLGLDLAVAVAPGLSSVHVRARDWKRRLSR